MLALLQQDYYWPQMGDEVQEYVKTCLTYQQDKVERKKKAGLLQPLPACKRSWVSVSLDFITVNVPNMGNSPRAISFSEEWKQNIDVAHSYLDKAAKRMEKHADKNRRSQEFIVGDKVMVKLLPLDRPNIRRPELKPKAAGKQVAKSILNDRVITVSRKHHQEYLVKWQGYTEEENTWERAADLSAYNNKIEAYHKQKLMRASTA
ncbi:hypothetical protein RJ639_038331 [Escallonia herrerae]|uniref:Chromo domain-containing protein n=1 Tax=Escallonia herrerae TaxID=1293975 RepID=A0AA89B6A6_9ASTE|nr:hypothetical protein RJ639_038331 [Escallonia herrerae]